MFLEASLSYVYVTVTTSVIVLNSRKSTTVLSVKPFNLPALIKYAKLMNIQLIHRVFGKPITVVPTHVPDITQNAYSGYFSGVGLTGTVAHG